jgi:hypothetical protein
MDQRLLLAAVITMLLYVAVNFRSSSVQPATSPGVSIQKSMDADILNWQLPTEMKNEYQQISF